MFVTARTAGIDIENYGKYFNYCQGGYTKDE